MPNRSRSLTAALVLLAGAAQAASFSPNSVLDFKLTAEKIKAECPRAKDRAVMNLAPIATLTDSARSFENTPQLLETVLWDLSDQTAAATFLKYVSVSSGVRDAANDCETQMEQFGVETFTRPDLFASVSSYAARKEKLAGENKKLLEKELLDFKRSGLALPADKREEVKKIKLRLAELEANFGKNLNNVKDSLLVSREELDGLPDDYIGRLQKEGSQYRVTLDYPDYFPFMNNATSAKTRALLENLYNNRATKENLPILKEVLSLRQQAAKLLGYPNHSAYVLEQRMAKTPAAVDAFLRRVESKLKPMAQQELALLLELKKEQEGEKSDGILHAWDWRFYDNFLKKSRYQVDDEAIKEYFPMDVVTDGMLSVYQLLLNVKFRQIPDAAVWHPDVKLYEITDANGPPAPIGYFYMDLYPREGKYKHAAAFSLIKGRQLPSGDYQAPVSAMVANFNKPTADRPSLLKHNEVDTYFHEFGHIMHQTLTRARYGRFSGSSVARDFVEAPSQMLENWVWSAEVLPMLSGHYKDRSQKLPKELLDKMIAAKNVNSGLIYLRQIFFGSIDMRYHTASEIADTTAEYEHLMGPVSLIPMSAGTHPEASFGHLMGYDSGYYGYLWSKVFAEDMFSRFEAEGVLNPVIGRLYRQAILEQGSSKDEAAILRDFLGREPNEKAFLKSIGLTKK